MEWIKSGADGYVEGARESVFILQKVISTIIEKDPNAIIVMLGDHGARTYLDLDLVEALKNNTIQLSEYADDFFNVYGAVRLPEQYEKFSFDDKDGYINHRNIFVHIFLC